MTFTLYTLILKLFIHSLTFLQTYRLSYFYYLSFPVVFLSSTVLKFSSCFSQFDSFEVFQLFFSV